MLNNQVSHGKIVAWKALIWTVNFHPFYLRGDLSDLVLSIQPMGYF